MTTLLWLVIFVFVIMIASALTASTIWLVMSMIGIIPPFVVGNMAYTIVYVGLISLLVSSVITLIAGDYLLKPLRQLTEGTRQIANGNFDVRVKVKGPRELEDLAISFNEMAKGLSNVEALREDFVSTISHEFKTPVASIQGFAKNLIKYNLSEEQRNEYLQIIVSESERLSRLSGNVLLLSKLESTERIIERQEYAVDEQLRRAILLLEPQIQKKQLKVEIALDEVTIVADEEIMNHLWINLLSNAIKFSPNDSTVKIKLESVDNAAVISIADQGMGMSEEVKARVFEKFYQSDVSRTTEGNGLGLSLVKRILELENGRISIESALAEGTCFTVTLPNRSG